MARIQECSCGAKFNVEKFPVGSKIRCKKCGGILTVADEPVVAPPPIPTPIPQRRETPRAETPRPIAEERPARSRIPEPAVPIPAPVEDDYTPEPMVEEGPPIRSRRGRPEPEPEEPPPARARREEAPEQSRRRTPAPIEEPVVEEEPEDVVEDIPEGVLVGKVDYAQRKREALAKAPSFFGVALILNFIVFIALIVGGYFVLNMMGGTVKSDAVESNVRTYQKTAEEVSKILKDKLIAAGMLGKVDQETIYRGVQKKYSTASERAVKGTVTVIADIDVFERGRPKRIEYYGSGFIFKPEGSLGIEGYVVTCYENIAGARSIRVMLHDKSVYPAKVIGKPDVPSNIAVLLLDQALLKAHNQVLYDVEWADSDAAKENVAQTVLSVGSPNGRANSVALGILSCPDRYTVYQVRTGESSGFYHQFFQTDAPINWGSTGGPLVDLDGKVVGVCVAGLHRAFGLTDYEGLFFAIHSNYVREIANSIRKYGKVNRSYTGIIFDSLKSLELPATEKGVAIAGIDADSPASSTDIKPGQLIYQIEYTDGENTVQKPINCRNSPDLGIIYHIFASLPINTELTLYVKENTGEGKRKVKIKTAPQPKSVDEIVVAERWGLVVSPLSKTESLQYGLPEGLGVKVIAVMENSAAERAYITPGFVIVSVDSKGIQNVNSFNSTYKNLDATRKKSFLIEGKRRSIAGLGTMANDFVKMVVNYD